MFFMERKPFSKRNLKNKKKTIFNELFKILQCKTEYEFRKNQQPLGEF